METIQPAIQRPQFMAFGISVIQIFSEWVFRILEGEGLAYKLIR